VITELEFKSLSAQGYNRIPLMVEAFADLETPLSLYLKLAFTKDGDKLVSDKVIPDGKGHPVVLQIRAKEGEKASTAKFTLNLAKCATCEHAEYACTCVHD
jgi:hypothetical protein